MRTLIICMFTFYFRISMSGARCHVISHWCSFVEVLLFIFVDFDVTGTRNTYQNVWQFKILIQNFGRSRMHSLYSVHVMSCHCSMFTENYHFSIFGIKWNRDIVITAISDHLSHAQGRGLVYFLFTNLECRSNGHVTAATAHHHVSRVVPLVLEIYLSYYHFLTVS